MGTEAVLVPQVPSRSLLEAFISRHEHLLQLERAAEEEQTRLLNTNCPPRLLEQRGLALGSLGVSSLSIGLGGKNLVELHRPSAYHTDHTLPPHTFRNGDPVRIEAHVAATNGKAKKKKDEVEENAVEGIVYRVSREKIVVAVDGGKDVDLPERLRLVKLANTITFYRMEKTLKNLRKILLPEPGASMPANYHLPLIDALLGIRPPTWLRSVPPPRSHPDDLTTKAQNGDAEGMKWFGSALNDSQKEAIEFCLKAEHVACIHGPPGTGKTHTLVELIFQLLSRPANFSTNLPPRILVTTPSNLALDNLLLRLHTLSKQPPYSTLLPSGSILRLGHPTRVQKELISETLDWKANNGDDGDLVRDVGKDIDGHMNDLGKKKGEKGAVKGKERGKKWEEIRILKKEYRQREAKVIVNVVKAAQVVLATCHSAGSKQLNNLAFDVCIVDEATQAVEAVCWVPILRSKKLILAGDPRQLPPTIMSKADKISSLPTDQSGSANKETKADPKVEHPTTDTTEGVQQELASTKINDSDGDDENRGSTSKHPVLKPPRTLETTLFDRLEKLYGAGIKRVLEVQYRMNSHIASFPSTTLYDSKLISDPSVANHTLLDLPSILDPENEDAKDTLEHPVVFFDTSGCEFYERSEGEESKSSKEDGGKGLGEGSKSNENEAEVVCKWAKKLVSLGVPAQDIAIVTPYQAQVSLISSMLHPEFPEMTIGSVDGLQGQEREAVILSLVRSNDTGEVGFLSEYRRLNVAMTRARRQLCVVGDSSTVSKGSKYLKDWMDWLEIKADVRWAGDQV